MLLESVELRQAPFILWIQDLAAKDPYFVLPLIMGLSMFIQQKLNPPAPRSYSANNDDDITRGLYRVIPVFPCWIGIVLGCE